MSENTQRRRPFNVSRLFTEARHPEEIVRFVIQSNASGTCYGLALLELHGHL